MIKKTISTIILSALPFVALAQLKAFPEAEGFGAFATGGRNGVVIKVTNLNATGSGSLQSAINATGPRIIVFDVSGIIDGDIHIPHGDLTIAGQTAPGAGITITGHMYTSYDEDISNIIMRHIRVRPHDPDNEWPSSQHDAIQFSDANNFIFDHIDASHGADETIDLWNGASHVTIQWSHLSFPIYDTNNGWTHNKGVINHRPCLDNNSCNANSRTGGYISILNNIFTHSRNRTPALSVGPAEIKNNLTYNGREGFVHHNVSAGQFNIIGNAYIDGPSASLSPFWFDPENNNPPVPTEYWLQDNYVQDPGAYVGVVENPWNDAAFMNEYTFVCCGIVSSQFNQSNLFDYTIHNNYQASITTVSTALEEKLTTTIGAHPHDVVARQSLLELEQRNGSWRNYRPANLMLGLTPTQAPLDSDGDGMPNDWENTHGLNPNNGNDHNTVMPSGYTAIEDYINGLASTMGNDVIFTNGFE